MRLPNGYGSVVKLSGNRRKSFWVRKTVGWTEKGYPKYFTIAYTKTRSEGLAILAEYNKDPWSVESNITLKDLYIKWKKERGILLGKSLYERLRFAYNHVKSLENVKYKSIKAFMMQDTINKCGKGYSTQAAIKNLWRHLDKYAFELDIITKQYSEILTSAPEEDSNRKPFSEKEIKQLWKFYFDGVPDMDIPLIFIYTGFRISELQFMRCEDIDMDEMIITGGIKTAAGKNRKVPIHPSIQALIKNRVNSSKYGFLFETRNGCYMTRFFREKFKKIMRFAEMNHIPHECRHTFETLLDNAGANRRCIDLLMGHTSKDIGNRVYNHKTITQLKDTIDLLKTPEMLEVSI